MRTFENEELSDLEFSEMLAAWEIPDPPAELRARVFPPKPIRLASSRQNRAIGAAFLMQAAAVALLLLVFPPRQIRDLIKKPVELTYLAPYRARLPAASKTGGGGGGGGQLAPTPVSKGAAPKIAPHQFIPPAVAVPKPLLPVVPTISAPAPQIEASVYGDPLSKLNISSGGQGRDGFGTGASGGIGGGDGDGYGPGRGGGTGGGVFRIGGEVSSPVLISKVEPEYSEEARKAKYSGMVLLSVVVDEHGLPQHIRVVRPLGLGLDEKAIEAVRRWRFRPGMRAGHPVAVVADVEVSFRLL